MEMYMKDILPIINLKEKEDIITVILIVFIKGFGKLEFSQGWVRYNLIMGLSSMGNGIKENQAQKQK
jgi:hypothetical protein